MNLKPIGLKNKKEAIKYAENYGNELKRYLMDSAGQLPLQDIKNYSQWEFETFFLNCLNNIKARGWKK